MLGRLLQENVRVIIEIASGIQPIGDLVVDFFRNRFLGPYSSPFYGIIMSHKRTIMILMVLVMALFTGCGAPNREKAISYSEFSHHSEDSLITSNLKAKFLRDPELEGRMIQIETTDGTVHLNGLVNNNFEAQRAENLAREIPGVISVENNLRVKLSR